MCVRVEGQPAPCEHGIKQSHNYGECKDIGIDIIIIRRFIPRVRTRARVRVRVRVRLRRGN